MSVRGQEHAILAAVTPAVTATATTAFKAFGNSVDLFVTTASGGAGTLTLALKSSFDGTTYYDCYDGDSAWAHTINVNAAGTYHDQIAYTFIPVQYYKFYYSCGVAAGTIAMTALSWENPAGTMSFTGDVVADMDLTNTNTATSAASVGTHDVAAASLLRGVRLLGNATTALQTAVSATGDDAKINTDLSGQVRLASHTIATTSDRSEEIDPLSAQYDAVSLISNEAVVLDPGASYAPSSAGQAWGGYGPLSIGLNILGGVGAAAADRTVTVTIEATNGQTVAAAVVWVDVTESVKSLFTGVDSAASFTSTGATAYSDILTLRREDSNFTHVRVKYDWNGDPSVTPGRIVAMARGAAL